MRHPVGFTRPIHAAEDFAGARIRAPLSRTSYRLIEALGAKPVEICCDEYAQAVGDGSITGADSAFILVGNLPRPGTLTTNITFYARVNIIVVNDDVFGRLSADEREILQAAAAETLRDALLHTPSEAESAEVYCRNGGTIAFAPEAELAALERAAEPVYDALESDPQTRELIEQIRRMKAQLSGGREPLPEACAPASDAAAPTTSSGPQPKAFPEGVYRADIGIAQTAEYLIQKGMDPPSAHELGGIKTLTFENGRWRDHTEGLAEDCVGPYSVEAGRVSLRQDRRECGEPAGTLVMSARWTLKRGELRFFDFRRGNPIEWGSKPWTKIN